MGKVNFVQLDQYILQLALMLPAMHVQSNKHGSNF